MVDCLKVFEDDNTKLVDVKLTIANNRKKDVGMAVIDFVFGLVNIEIKFINI